MLTHRSRSILGDIPQDWQAKPLRKLLTEQFAGDWGSDEGEQAVAVIAAALKLATDAIYKTRVQLSAAREFLRTLLKDLFEQGVVASEGLNRSKWTTCPIHWAIRPLKRFATVQSGFTMGRDLSRAETVELGQPCVRPDEIA